MPDPLARDNPLTIRESLTICEPLTSRETQVLQLIADGLLNREIAVELFVAEETVKTHIHHILGKLGARSRTHAAAIGLRGRLID